MNFRSSIQSDTTAPTDIPSRTRAMTSMHVGSTTPVLLQTACVTVYNPNCPETSHNIRLILDSGSQRSYLTNDIKEALGLETTHSETL